MDGLAALRVQLDWGADEALEEAPVDRRRDPSAHATAGNAAATPAAASARPAVPAPAQATPAQARSATPPGIAAEQAAHAAAAAASLPALREAIAGFTLCPLSATAANLVFAAGSADAPLLVIGEAPGDEDDREGAPFSGPSGAMLDRMLASIGLDRAGILLAPLIPWRPPGGRSPSPAELSMCLPFLFRLIALARPRRIVLAGQMAARALLGPAGTRQSTRGTWQALRLPDAPPEQPALAVLAMASPGFLRANPSARRQAWADLRRLRRALDADLTKT